jgi:hypothetical protein
MHGVWRKIRTRPVICRWSPEMDWKLWLIVGFAISIAVALALGKLLSLGADDDDEPWVEE